MTQAFHMASDGQDIKPVTCSWKQAFLMILCLIKSWERLILKALFLLTF